MCIVLNKKEGASCITTHLLFYFILPIKPSADTQALKNTGFIETQK